MQAVAGGDLDAFNEIVLRYQQQAWRTAYRLLGDAIPDRPSSLPSAMENMVSRERGEEIRHALKSLPLNQRTAMVLKHDQGLSYAEIAQVMDTTPKSVEMLIRRARKNLHAKLSHLNIHKS